MSDRYETPSWDDEPEDLGSGNRITADAADGDDVEEASAEDVDLDAASENVFDAWPVSAPPADEEVDEASAEDAVADDTSAGVAEARAVAEA